ncbi:hypothetical protein JRQ81_011010 [Phrynocephalus forsythii]|uniref:RZ-type domain-containing protein n=1 Tax=Phrynocephalus forsythii TaxID=171643 RepID=A0A9Q0Y0J9_9SAUR|nr:hypothetical protein JRQ81_011010 [Phrynocephalus forsythii]
MSERKRRWNRLAGSIGHSPGPPPCKAPRCSPEPGPSWRLEEEDREPSPLAALERLCLHPQPKQLLAFFATHDYALARVLGSPGLHPGEVYALLRAIRHGLEGRPSVARQEAQPMLSLVLQPPFLLQSLLGFIAHLESFCGQEGPRLQEVTGDTVAALHHLLEASPGHAHTLLCYPLDLLGATLGRLQSRGFRFTWVTQKQLWDTKGLLDKAFATLRGPRGAQPESPANQEDFRLIPVFPTPEDIFLEPMRRLKANVLSGRYPSDQAYLDTHFRLLREDLVRPLREGISSRFALRSLFSDSKKPAGELRLYRNVQLVGVGTSPAGVIFLAEFRCSRRSHAATASSKHLLSGSLVCLFSEDGSHVLFGTVAGTTGTSLRPGAVWLDFRQSHARLLSHVGTTTFTMVESPAFFEAYRHVLAGLQELEPSSPVPFSCYLVRCSREVFRPFYLEAEGATLDLRALHGLKGKADPLAPASRPVAAPASSTCEDRAQVEEVPLVDVSAVSPLSAHIWTPRVFPLLDESQLSAIRMALSTEFALIQGPPGTGKTFIGLKLLEILLDNQALWNQDRAPCLVVCYTNHALDQFLEGILEFLPSGVVRVGGRSRSEKVMACSLKNLRKKYLSGFLMTSDKKHFGWVSPSQGGGMDGGEAGDGHSSCGVTQLLARGWRWSSTHHAQFSQYHRDERWLDDDDGVLRTKSWCLAGPLGGNSLTLCPRKGGRSQGGSRREEVESGQGASLGGGHRVQHHPHPRAASWKEGPGGCFWEPPPPQGCLPPSTTAGCREAPGWLPPFLSFPPPSSAQPHFSLSSRTPQAWLLGFLAGGGTMTNEEVATVHNVWSLRPKDRWRLYRRWVAAYEVKLKAALAEEMKHYEKEAAQLEELSFQEDLRILRQSRVIGMTTTGAAKYRKLLQSVGPPIVIVEEAAEILEAHVLTSLSSSCKHLILIGDHQQLRPKPAHYTLEKKYGLGISLFERMVNNRLPHVQLLYQHRMRPEISQLLVPCFYKELHDHQAVLKYENIKGVERNVFFVQHGEEESPSADTESYSNPHEATFLVSLAKYLLKQGYGPSQINILTPYHGQVMRIRALLLQAEMENVSAHAVDDFQGEENDIVLLSLVRSNRQGSIGFLRDKNRLCVALSRAKKGFYCIGNLEVLSACSPLWKRMVGLLKAKDLLGEELVLMCQNHPETKTAVKDSEGFSQLPDGGCTLECQVRLECGHPCGRHCHPTDRDHRRHVCKFPCGKTLCELNHQCPRKCSMPCGPCKVPVQKVISKCGHSQTLPCHLPAAAWVCKEPCQQLLKCSHPCPLHCGEDCRAARCKQRVEVSLSCAHVTQTECFRQGEPLRCHVKCEQKLDCGHMCQGSCSDCLQGRLHTECRKKCTRVLLCSHTCQGSCCENCPPCRKKCQSRCSHSRCDRHCGQVCFPCKQPCSWRCKHYRCTQRCWEVCNRPRCNEPCPRTLKCKHPCVGLCGEPCPPKCRVCHRDELTEVFFGSEDELDARFVFLEDCHHILEVGGLDRWMDGEPGPGGAQQIQQKVCPRCSIPIQRNPRYSNILKTTQQRIEEVKRMVQGTEEELQERRAQLRRLLMESKASSCFAPTALAGKIQESASLQDLKDCENTVSFLLCLQRLKEQSATCTEERRACLKEEIGQVESWLLCRRQEGPAFTTQQLRECRGEVKRISYLANVFQRLSLWEKSHSTSSQEAVATVAEVWGMLSGKRLFTEAQEELLRPLLETLEQLLPDSGPRLSEAEKVSILEAMRFGRGQWYMCPQGHFYTVGQCGRPMEESKCPECGAAIGGHNHRLRSDNISADPTQGFRDRGRAEGRPLTNIAASMAPSDHLPVPTATAIMPPCLPGGSPSQASDSLGEAGGSPYYCSVSQTHLPPVGTPTGPCRCSGSEPEGTLEEQQQEEEEEEKEKEEEEGEEREEEEEEVEAEEEKEEEEGEEREEEKEEVEVEAEEEKEKEEEEMEAKEEDEQEEEEREQEVQQEEEEEEKEKVEEGEEREEEEEEEKEKEEVEAEEKKEMEAKEEEEEEREQEVQQEEEAEEEKEEEEGEEREEEKEDEEEKKR